MQQSGRPPRTRDLTDVVLVAGAQRGERGALDELLRRHYDRIYGLCRRITTHDADAADATQHALIAIAKGIARFDGTSAFSTWTYRIATNAALDELRRRKRRPQPLGESDDDRPGSFSRPSDTSGDATGDATAVRLDIEVALRSLPHDFRAAVVLRDLCGLDYAEIAEILDIPPGTVRSRIARGRAALAPLLPQVDATKDFTADAGPSAPTAGNRDAADGRQRNHDA